MCTNQQCVLTQVLTKQVELYIYGCIQSSSLCMNAPHDVLTLWLSYSATWIQRTLVRPSLVAGLHCSLDTKDTLATQFSGWFTEVQMD